MKLEIKKLHCERCQHDWVPKQEEVRQCPKCKSPWWDTKKK